MEFFQVIVGEGPIVSAAIHSGSHLRAELLDSMTLTEAERLREEDPFTDFLADVVPTRIVGLRSRFEVDLNRPPEDSVYATPEQAWGLNVWRQPLSPDAIKRSRGLHELFYETVGGVLRRLVERHGRVVLLDVHSYNHRREGADAPPAGEAENPEINVGTASLDRAIWGPVIDALIDQLRACEVDGRPLDVRENVKFRGGHFPRWIHREFPGVVCAPAIEFKKTFMDEWTGAADDAHLLQLREALRQCVPALLDALQQLDSP